MAHLVMTHGTMMLSKADALRIQAEHVAHYSACYGPHVADLVAAATTADHLADGLHYVVVINRHIPRGGAIEALIPEKVAHEAEIRQRADAIRAERSR